MKAWLTSELSPHLLQAGHDVVHHYILQGQIGQPGNW